MSIHRISLICIVAFSVCFLSSSMDSRIVRRTTLLFSYIFFSVLFEGNRGPVGH